MLYMYLTWAAIPSWLVFVGRARAQSSVVAYLTSAYQIAPSDASTLASQLHCSDTLSITTSIDSLGRTSVRCLALGQQPRTLGSLEPDNYVQFFQAALSPAPMPGGPGWQPLPSRTITTGPGPNAVATAAFDPRTSLQSFSTANCQSDSCATNKCSPVVGPSSTYASPISDISAATCASDTCQCPTPTASSTWWMSQPYTISSLWMTSTFDLDQSVTAYTAVPSCDANACAAHICYPVVEGTYDGSGGSTTPSPGPATCVSATPSDTICQCSSWTSGPSKQYYGMFMARPTDGAVADPFQPSLDFQSTRFFHQIPFTASAQDCATACASMECSSLFDNASGSPSIMIAVTAAYCKPSSVYLAVSTETPAVLSTVSTTTSGGTTVTSLDTLTPASTSMIIATGPMCTCSASAHWLASSSLPQGNAPTKTDTTTLGSTTFVHNFPIATAPNTPCNTACAQFNCLNLSGGSIGPSSGLASCAPSVAYTSYYSVSPTPTTVTSTGTSLGSTFTTIVVQTITESSLVLTTDVCTCPAPDPWLASPAYNDGVGQITLVTINSSPTVYVRGLENPTPAIDCASACTTYTCGDVSGNPKSTASCLKNVDWTYWYAAASAVSSTVLTSTSRCGCSQPTDWIRDPKQTDGPNSVGWVSTVIGGSTYVPNYSYASSLACSDICTGVCSSLRGTALVSTATGTPTCSSGVTRLSIVPPGYPTPVTEDICLCPTPSMWMVAPSQWPYVQPSATQITTLSASGVLVRDMPNPSPGSDCTAACASYTCGDASSSNTAPALCRPSSSLSGSSFTWYSSTMSTYAPVTTLGDECYCSGADKWILNPGLTPRGAPAAQSTTISGSGYVLAYPVPTSATTSCSAFCASFTCSSASGVPGSLITNGQSAAICQTTSSTPSCTCASTNMWLPTLAGNDAATQTTKISGSTYVLAYSVPTSATASCSAFCASVTCSSASGAPASLITNGQSAAICQTTTGTPSCTCASPSMWLPSPAAATDDFTSTAAMFYVRGLPAPYTEDCNAACSSLVSCTSLPTDTGSGSTPSPATCQTSDSWTLVSQVPGSSANGATATPTVSRFTVHGDRCGCPNSSMWINSQPVFPTPLTSGSATYSQRILADTSSVSDCTSWCSGFSCTSFSSQRRVITATPSAASCFAGVGVETASEDKETSSSSTTTILKVETNYQNFCTCKDMDNWILSTSRGS